MLLPAERHIMRDFINYLEIYMSYKIKILSLFLFVTMNESFFCNNGKDNHETVNKIQECDSKPNNNKNNMIKTFSCKVTRGVPLPKEEDRGGHIGGIVENKIIVSGGNRWSEDKTQKFFLNNTLIFDGRQWIKGPSLPIPMAYSMFACDHSGLYVAGGTSDGITMLKEVYVLRSIQKGKKWERLPDLPEAIGFGAGTILKDKFYIAGGVLNNGEKTNKMWTLDLNDLESGWSESISIPGKARYLQAMTTVGEHLYIIGGLTETSPLSPLNEVYIYDYDENMWEKLMDLPLKGYAWTAQPIDNTSILITGRADGQVHPDIWIVDLVTMTMDKVGDLIIQSATSPLIKVTDNQWWVVGGEPDSNKNRTKETSMITIIDDEYDNNNR